MLHVLYAVDGLLQDNQDRSTRTLALARDKETRRALGGSDGGKLRHGQGFDRQQPQHDDYRIDVVVSGMFMNVVDPIRKMWIRS